MIRAILIGTLHTAPQERMSKAGKPFVTARMSVDSTDGRLFASIIVFDADTAARLLELPAGASLAAAGVLKIGIYEAKNGTAYPNLDLVADEIAATRPRPKKPRAERQHSAVRDESLPDGSDWLDA